MSVINFATMKSQWMQHLYQPAHGDFLYGDAPLAKALHAHAIKANPIIATLGRELVTLDTEYAARMARSTLAVQTSRHAGDIEALAGKMLLGTVATPAWETQGASVVDQVAGLRAELAHKARALDGAYVAFEKDFFATAEGAKFKGYIEAMKAGDFAACNAALKAEEAAAAALLKPPTELSKPGAPAQQVVATERAAMAESESFLAKMARNKLKVGAGVAAVLAVTGWAAYEMSKQQPSGKKER